MSNEGKQRAEVVVARKARSNNKFDLESILSNQH